MSVYNVICLSYYRTFFVIQLCHNYSTPIQYCCLFLNHLFVKSLNWVILASLLQALVSHNPPKIILLCWFGVQEYVLLNIIMLRWLMFVKAMIFCFRSLWWIESSIIKRLDPNLLNSSVILLSQAENIMLLELDISPPTMVPLDLQRSDIRTQDLIRDFSLYRKQTTASRVMKARSWWVPCTSSIIQQLPRRLKWIVRI